MEKIKAEGMSMPSIAIMSIGAFVSLLLQGPFEHASKFSWMKPVTIVFYAILICYTISLLVCHTLSLNNLISRKIKRRINRGITIIALVYILTVTLAAILNYIFIPEPESAQESLSRRNEELAITQSKFPDPLYVMSNDMMIIGEEFYLNRNYQNYGSVYEMLFTVTNPGNVSSIAIEGVYIEVIDFRSARDVYYLTFSGEYGGGIENHHFFGRINSATDNYRLMYIGEGDNYYLLGDRDPVVVHKKVNLAPSEAMDLTLNVICNDTGFYTYRVRIDYILGAETLSCYSENLRFTFVSGSIPDENFAEFEAFRDGDNAARKKKLMQQFLKSVNILDKKDFDTFADIVRDRNNG